MSETQTKYLSWGKLKLFASKISQGMTQRSAAATDHVDLLSPSSACQPIHALTTRGHQSTITTTTSRVTSESSSQDKEDRFNIKGEIVTPPTGHTQGYSSKNVSDGTTRDYHDVLDLCSPG